MKEGLFSKFNGFKKNFSRLTKSFLVTPLLYLCGIKENPWGDLNEFETQLQLGVDWQGCFIESRSH